MSDSKKALGRLLDTLGRSRSPRAGRCGVRIEDLVAVLEEIEVGTADRRRSVRVLDLAKQNALDRIAPVPPGTSGDAERGGSSSPVEESERVEASRVSRQASRDAVQVDLICKRLEREARDLAALVVRQTATVDHSKLPAGTIPGCVSCARPQRRGDPHSGYFSPVAEPDPHGEKRWGRSLAESVAAFALCSFCRLHAVANARRAGATEVLTGHFVRLEAVDLLHRESEQAAGRWLAQNDGAAA